VPRPAQAAAERSDALLSVRQSEEQRQAVRPRLVRDVPAKSSRRSTDNRLVQERAVPGSLTELIRKLSESGTDVLTRNIAARSARVRSYLGALGELRTYIKNSQNYGHQASSVNILRNLIRMGCPGPYTLVLDGTDKRDINDLVHKLHLLIPEFAGLDQP